MVADTARLALTGPGRHRPWVRLRVLALWREAAERAQAPEAARLGVHARVERIDWPAIVERVFGRIDSIAAGGEELVAHADVLLDEADQMRRGRFDSVPVGLLDGLALGLEPAGDSGGKAGDLSG